MKKNLLLFFILAPIVNCLHAQEQNLTPSNASQLLDISKQNREKDIRDLNKAKAQNVTIQEVLDDGTVIGFVRFDENGHPVYYQTDNSDAAATVGTDKVWPGGTAGYSLSGNSIEVGEWDGGEVRGTHVEFGNRITQIDNPSSLSDHATHVAGTMVAAGIDSDAKGMAFQATVSAHDFFSDNSEIATYSSGTNKILSNHSYGRITGWRFVSSSGVWRWYGDTTISVVEDYAFGFYSFDARQWDLIANNAPYYLIVKSAGNDRNDALPSNVTSHDVWDNSSGSWVTSTASRPGDCPTGYDCISSAGNAKNILTVGAVSDIPLGYSLPSDVVMSSFSGWGPTDDGRIKPDIVANGVSLYSTGSSSNSDYYNSSGTSMSAPNATGSLALIQEHYNDSNNAFLKAATLKGLVIHTADEAGSFAGPDYSNGWGLLNTERAVSTLSDTSIHIIEENTLSNNGTYSFTVYSDGMSPLWATISWNDPAAISPSVSLDPTTSMLVNDLDLRILDVASNTYLPYVLNPASPASAATTGDNFRDNVEKVYIANPTAGFYTVTVGHKGTLPGAGQDYSLLLSGKSNAPQVSNPPVAAFTQSATTICAGDTINFTDLSTNTPTGWNWSFSGPIQLNSSLQNPTVQFNTAGTYDVTLIASNNDGPDTLEVTNLVTVVAPPVINFTVPPICHNDTDFVLNIATPSGGTYSGVGVSNNTFSPSTAGIGSHTITYTVSNGTCSSTSSTALIVNGTVLNVQTVPSLCLGDVQNLTGTVMPSGGLFYGTGVTGNTFNSSVAGVGVHKIYYGLLDANGCANVDSFNITVTNPPTASLGAFADLCSSSSILTLSGGSPAGGTYIIGNTPSSTFDPSVQGVGIHSIGYVVVSGSCSDTAFSTIEVLNSPVVSLASISPVCLDQTAFALTGGIPSGGTYSGNGVSGGQFDPSVAGAGNHMVYYSAGSGTCIGIDSQLVVVNPLPNVTHAIVPDVCMGTPAFALTGGSPSGGAYSGTGVSSGMFDPTSAGLGIHNLTYSYINSLGCSDSVNFTVEVVASAGNVTLGSFSSVCMNQAAFPLIGGSPSGGNYSGTGVNNGMFDPALAGVGTHMIYYTIGNGVCAGVDSQQIVVNTPPVVTHPNGPTICSGSPAITLVGGTPSGGVYSGVGVSNGIFDPTVAGSGVHTLNYVFTNSVGCSDTALFTIAVSNTVGSASLPALGTVCLSSTSFQLTGGTPLGGVYSGPGVDPTTGTFDPASAGVGIHSIQYTVNTGGCFAADTQNIEVVAAPSVSHIPVGDVCLAGGIVDLDGMGSPSGGTYVGTGMTGTIFDPVVAGLGVHSITYSVTNSNGCVGDTTIQINVVSTVAVTMVDSSMCEADGMLTLDWGSPVGGFYSGTGVNGNIFDAHVSGVGIHQVTYTYSQNGCQGATTAEIRVDSSPVVTLDPFIDVCIGASDIILNTGLPSGGVYSGTGVSNGLFSAQIAGIGVHAITYEYTSSNGCSGSAVESIEVLQGSNAQITNSFDSICSNDAPLALNASPSGGVFTGPGVVGTDFDPSLATVGWNTISYVMTGACSDSVSKEVFVNQAPVISGISGPLVSYNNHNESYFVPANNGSQYVWSVTNGTVVLVNNNVIQIEWSSSLFGSIEVVEYAQNGCTDTAYIDVQLWPLSNSSSNTPDFEMKTSFVSSAQLKVDLIGVVENDAKLSVVGLDGKIHRTSSLGGGSYWIFDLNSLSQGIYILNYSSDKKQITSKIRLIK